MESHHTCGSHQAQSDIVCNVKYGVIELCTMSAVLFNNDIDCVMKKTTEGPIRGIIRRLFSFLEDDSGVSSNTCSSVLRNFSIARAAPAQRVTMATGKQDKHLRFACGSSDNDMLDAIKEALEDVWMTMSYPASQNGLLQS